MTKIAGIDEHVPEAVQSRQRTHASWQKLIWIGAGGALFLVILMLLGLVAWTVARTTEIFASNENADLAFIMTGISMVTLTLLRFLAILIGGAIAFAGLAVSFFVHDNANILNVGVEENSKALPKVTLATYSPGLVGLVVGAIVIVSALFATSQHQYIAPTSIEVVQPSAEAKNYKAAPMKSSDAILGESK